MGYGTGRIPTPAARAEQARFSYRTTPFSRLSDRGLGGLGIERDVHFTATVPLTVYADAAYREGYITTVPRLLGVEEIHTST